MGFEVVPDALPAPQAYLRAGLPRPNRRDRRRREWLDEESGLEGGPTVEDVLARDVSGGRSVTYLDESGRPAAITYARSAQYLTRPVRRRWTDKPVREVSRMDDGVLRIVVGGRRDFPGQADPPQVPVDTTTCKVVTFDTSVFLHGVYPALFDPDDAVFVSAALATEIIVASEWDQDLDVRATPFHVWDLSEPVPVDDHVLRLFHYLVSERNVFPRPGLHRTDALIAATAILYKAPLYTTQPELYRGFGLGLRVVEYGRIRNREAPAPG